MALSDDFPNVDESDDDDDDVDSLPDDANLELDTDVKRVLCWIVWWNSNFNKLWLGKEYTSLRLLPRAIKIEF